MSDIDSHRAAVHRAFDAAYEHGAREFHEFLERCEGADPRLIEEIFASRYRSSPHSAPAETRRATSELAARFPAADPLAYQWWYTVGTSERLATRLFQSLVNPAATVAFLGAPSTAFHYAARYGPAVAFEIDKDVIQAMQRVERLKLVTYDVATTLPPEHSSKYAAVLTDPPWYPEILRDFLGRALEMASVGADIFCSLPPRLTRPTIVDERQELIRELVGIGVEVVAIEPSATRYVVPEFERQAYSHLGHFDGRPWRTGDLLHIRKRGTAQIDARSLVTYDVKTYSRKASAFRIFVRTNARNHTNASAWVTKEPKFSASVSRRALDPATLDWWTSDRNGGTFRNPEATRTALHVWAAKGDFADAESALLKEGLSPLDAKSLCDDLNRNLGLWTKHGFKSVRAPVSEDTAALSAPFATNKASHRPYVRTSDDGYRRAFPRDRDRIVWSRGLRQLANKTQVFPVTSDDFLRNRLAHSMEVAQLASTIGASFGLNPHLIEAGALAHDIGHTPFGHAGEHALDHLFNEIKRELGGFNHYEHGVDVIRWLEDAYQSPALGGIHGLNLTSEVAECIFKHTYCVSKDRFSQAELYSRSKHRTYFGNDLCHVEGQAVRLADKISYLISDLEDGIRMGVFTASDLTSCRLLRRPPLDFNLDHGESLHERFLSQRAILIGILMEDAIDNTDRLLSGLGSVAAVRKAQNYTVNHSEEMQEEVSEIWHHLQAGKLHRDARVQLANMQAARTVRELTLMLAVSPELVDTRFSQGHSRLNSTEYMKFYRDRSGSSIKLSAEALAFLGAKGAPGFSLVGTDPEIPIEHLVQAKDFVAGLTDARARALHRECLRGDNT